MNGIDAMHTAEDAPVMRLEVLRTLLGLVKEKQCDLVLWQPERSLISGIPYEIQTLRALDLCSEAFPYICRIADYQREASEAKKEAEELRGTIQRQAERISWLEMEADDDYA